MRKFRLLIIALTSMSLLISIKAQVVMDTVHGGAGMIETYGANDTINTRIGTNGANRGGMFLFDQSGNLRIHMFVSAGDNGGAFRINSDSAVAVLLRSDFTNGNGVLHLNGPSTTVNNPNVVLDNSDSSNDPGDGAVYVFDDTGTKRAGIEINSNNEGVLFADVKNFRIPHPNISDKEIWYASLEGPEVGAYIRGTGQLEQGTTFVSFPDHFSSIIDPSTYTVTITPLSAETSGIAVVAKEQNGFWVEELKGGTSDISFDYDVKGRRLGHEDFEVVRDKE